MTLRAIHLDSYDAEAHQAYARFLRLLALTLQDDYYQWKLSTDEQTRVATTGTSREHAAPQRASDAPPLAAPWRGAERPSDPTPIDSYSRRVPCS